MKSPCILICQLDDDTGLCVGCQRSGDEIARWAAMSDAEREAVMADLPRRARMAKAG